MIVDDHVMLREGLASLIDPQPDFEVVGEVGTVAEAVQAVREVEPDIILMDFSLPDGSGLEATQAILGANPDISIVFLTVHDADENLFAAIRSGASGYLLKILPISQLLEYLRGLRFGRAPISPEMTSRILREFSRGEKTQDSDLGVLYQLTSREIEVLSEITTGATNSQIAQRLFISENTVKNHIHNILEKLNLKSRQEAAVYAIQHGIGKSLPRR